jgi:endoglucanase
MNDNRDFLKAMMSTSGLSGHEGPISTLIREKWDPLVDELSTSRIGSLHGLKRGHGEAPRRSIMIATHMDAIGLMVTQIQGEFMRMTEIGGIDPRVLPGQPVVIHGREDLPARVVQPPAWLLPEGIGSGAIGLDYLLIDAGLPADELARLVRIGDRVSFGQEPIELGPKALAGHSLDNRASVAALTYTLQYLERRLHNWDVVATATVQEEETMGGALTSTHSLRPDLAIAVDVTHAQSPGTSSHETYELGAGPVLAWGPNIHMGFHKAVKQTADQIEMETQFEATPRHSGTDAYGIQISAEGVPTMVISIALRYMHTPVELIHLQDVERVGRLMAEFISGLDDDFMTNLSVDGD